MLIIPAAIFKLGLWSENSNLRVVSWFLIALPLTGFAVFTFSSSYANNPCVHIHIALVYFHGVKYLTHFLLIIDKSFSQNNLKLFTVIFSAPPPPPPTLVRLYLQSLLYLLKRQKSSQS